MILSINLRTGKIFVNFGFQIRPFIPKHFYYKYNESNRNKLHLSSFHVVCLFAFMSQ